MTTHEQLSRQYDLAVVGGGIIGLAHAYLAARKGLKVVVIERDGAATGASVRNFGFITITVHESAPLNVPSEMLRPLNAGPCSGHADES